MKDYKRYKLNLIPSPPDSRDWKYETIVKEFLLKLPSVLDWRTSMFPVRDQGYQGSCAAMAGAAMKDWQEIKDIAVSEYMSPQFIYNNRENQSSEGMSMRDLMRILKTYGACKESLHPYGNLSKPTVEAYENGKRFIIRGYASISTIDGLKTALYENGPCVIAVPVYNYTNRMWKQRSGDKQLGGHAMTVVGYNEAGFIIRNSWGNTWNGDGCTIFPYDDWGCHWELWTTVDADSNPAPSPEPEPTPVPEKTWFEKYWWIIIGALVLVLAVAAFFIF